MIEKINEYNISKKSKENIKIYYTNSILLAINNLEGEEKKKYIKEIRNPIKQLKREIYLLKEYLKYYGVDLWIEGYVLFVNMNSPVESEYTVNDKNEIDDKESKYYDKLQEYQKVVYYKLFDE